MTKHNTPETYEQDYKLVKNTQDAADIKTTMMQDKEASYEAKYKARLTRYGLERTETDYEKDMKEYAPRIKAAIDKTKEANKTASVKDISRPAREERDIKALRNHETKVSVNKSGGATAETTSAPKRRASTPSTSKPTTTRDTQSLRSDAARKAESSTPSTSKPAPKPTATPSKGYAVEEQDVNNINGSNAKTMLYNDRVKLKIKAQRNKTETTPRTAKVTLSTLRNEYQQELMKKHKKELAGK